MGNSQSAVLAAKSSRSPSFRLLTLKLKSQALTVHHTHHLPCSLRSSFDLKIHDTLRLIVSPALSWLMRHAPATVIAPQVQRTYRASDNENSRMGQFHETATLRPTRILYSTLLRVSHNLGSMFVGSGLSNTSFRTCGAGRQQSYEQLSITDDTERHPFRFSQEL